MDISADDIPGDDLTVSPSGPGDAPSAIPGLLDGLTDPQRQAVLTTEGPVLILAAAGSGKTRVITRRIAHLLSIGVAPWSILALTFTNKAAGEMRERVLALLEEAGDPTGVVRHRDDGSRWLGGLTITTFHSLCARLLRRYADAAQTIPGWRVKPDYTIYDSSDQMSLMKKTIKAMDLSTSNWSPRQVLSAISNAKNELLTPTKYEEQAWDFSTRTISKIYAKYEAALRSANAVDFDDLLLLTVTMLRESEAIRDELRARWQYLMIDEYQDTNRVQFMLSSLLIGGDESIDPDGSGADGRGRGPNVCVVGDPDQSIYGWRGADISNILDFETRYPGAETIALGQNFRSTRHILGAADALIKHNVRRKDKPLYTETDGGEKPTVTLVRSEQHEAELVCDWVKLLVEGRSAVAGDAYDGLIGADGSALLPEDLVGKLGYKDIAVFYRNNALSRVVEDALRRAGMPYVIARGTAFYEREEVKDTIAYLRVVANTADDVSLERIINKPARKIGKKTLDTLRLFASKYQTTLFEAARRVREAPGLGDAAMKAVEGFVAMVDGWNGAGTFMGAAVPTSLADLVERVINESRLERHYASKLDKATGEPDEDRLANLEELINSAAEFEDTFDPTSDPAFAEAPTPDAEPNVAASADEPELLQMLRAYLESVALVADADKVDPAKGAVTLMTLHAAKGLEFPAVAIVGLEEGLLPGQRAMDSDDDLEEERRLTFVGITRAMRTLLMTSAKYRTHRGVRERTIPSRFLAELPAEHITVSDQSDEFGGLGAGWEDDDDGRRDWADDGLGDADHDPFPEDEFDQRPEHEKRQAAMQGREQRRAAKRADLSSKISRGFSTGPGSLDRGDYSNQMAANRKRAARRGGAGGGGGGGRGSGGGGGGRDAFAPARRVGAQLEAGMIVKHPQFGEGLVESVSGMGMKKRATIDFADLGRRTLVLGYTRLDPVGWAEGKGPDGATTAEPSLDRHDDEPPF